VLRQGLQAGWPALNGRRLARRQSAANPGAQRFCVDDSGAFSVRALIADASLDFSVSR